MLEIDFFPIYGLIVGINYSDEDIEQNLKKKHC